MNSERTHHAVQFSSQALHYPTTQCHSTASGYCHSTTVPHSCTASLVVAVAPAHTPTLTMTFPSRPVPPPCLLASRAPCPLVTPALPCSFYQLLPHTTHWTWGLAWGHAVSSDLVTWRRLPPALLPGGKHTARQQLQQACGQQQQHNVAFDSGMQEQAAAAAGEAASGFLRDAAAEEKATAGGGAASAAAREVTVAVVTEGEVQEQRQLAEAAAAAVVGGAGAKGNDSGGDPHAISSGCPAEHPDSYAGPLQHDANDTTHRAYPACHQQHAAIPDDPYPASAITHERADHHGPTTPPQAAGHGPRAREGGSSGARAGSSAGGQASQRLGNSGEEGGDPWFDADGCFSGCAVVDPRGVPTLLYTGVR